MPKGKVDLIDFKILVGIIGEDLASDVVNELGGLTIYIPVAKSIRRNSRNISIYEDWKNGVNYRMLAFKYRLTKNRVKQIVREKLNETKSKKKGG